MLQAGRPKRDFQVNGLEIIKNERLNPATLLMIPRQMAEPAECCIHRKNQNNPENSSGLILTVSGRCLPRVEIPGYVVRRVDRRC